MSSKLTEQQKQAIFEAHQTEYRKRNQEIDITQVIKELFDITISNWGETTLEELKQILDKIAGDEHSLGKEKDILFETLQDDLCLLREFIEHQLRIRVLNEFAGETPLAFFDSLNILLKITQEITGEQHAFMGQYPYEEIISDNPESSPFVGYWLAEIIGFVAELKYYGNTDVIKTFSMENLLPQDVIQLLLYIIDGRSELEIKFHTWTRNSHNPLQEREISLIKKMLLKEFSPEEIEKLRTIQKIIDEAYTQKGRAKWKQQAAIREANEKFEKNMNNATKKEQSALNLWGES